MRIRFQLLPQCGSGSREPNQCGSNGNRILVKLCCHLNLSLRVGHKTHIKQKPFCSTPLFLDPNPQFKYGSGSKRANKADPCGSGSTPMREIVPLRTCADLTFTVFYIPVQPPQTALIFFKKNCLWTNTVILFEWKGSFYHLRIWLLVFLLESIFSIFFPISSTGTSV